MAQPLSEPARADDAGVDIVVCYASANTEFLKAVHVASGTNIGQAIEQSGVLQVYPEIDLASHPVGLFGKKKTLDTVLRQHDRIEIYRPLVADPKETRRKRAHQRREAV